MNDDCTPLYEKSLVKVMYIKMPWYCPSHFVVMVTYTGIEEPEIHIAAPPLRNYTDVSSTTVDDHIDTMVVSMI
jgi:hypothetical protein